ncbi:MAG TPA: helix-turn-helix domain-containing protein, partial [Jiangellaceae bacterium]|nr:helix-turn-helix domain-containing protein [Jiangellaceae bacterium]
MEINPTYGPRPPTPTTGAAANLSASRAALLDQLVGQPEPTTIAALVAASGLHQNTVREHLDALVSVGLARRVTGVARGRGRPAWRYQAVEPRETEPAAAEYAGLASVLADHIARTSDDPRADAVSAGVSWGRELAGRSTPADTPLDARREV